jgi:hypothetical protein
MPESRRAPSKKQPDGPGAGAVGLGAGAVGTGTGAVPEGAGVKGSGLGTRMGGGVIPAGVGAGGVAGGGGSGGKSKNLGVRAAAKTRATKAGRWADLDKVSWKAGPHGTWPALVIPASRPRCPPLTAQR